jgi:hypothetical protein
MINVCIFSFQNCVDKNVTLLCPANISTKPLLSPRLLEHQTPLMHQNMGMIGRRREGGRERRRKGWRGKQG